jgi:hypothetical protein
MGKQAKPSARVHMAKVALERRLSAEDGFVGAGLSRTEAGDDEIVVLVRDAESAAAANTPGECDGVPVRTEVVGRPRKQ